PMAELKTNIATSDERTITVRGKNLVDELIGRYSFTEMVYFLICNRFPTAAQTRILDACLVTLMEHGLTPSAIMARLAVDNVPDQLQSAMAAGLMVVGDTFVGTMDGCARILQKGLSQGGDLDAYCQAVVAEHRAQRKAIPGFGHPIHRPDDPRPP